MSDHPDIEKIAADTNGVIDGISVRETIREIFRNPENGTPDNISKAGCLALALRSNEVGRNGAGHVVWNAWRKVFPTRREMSQPTPVGSFVVHYRFWANVVDFSFLHVEKTAPALNQFSDFQFGDGADFRGARLGDKANFRSAYFGDDAMFAAAHFGQMADFSGAQFGDGANFSVAQFANWVYFIAAQFGDDANFSASRFGKNAIFSAAQFGSGASFCAAQFGDGADFSAQTWEEVRGGYGERFKAAKDWATKQGVSPQNLKSIDFSGAAFAGQVDFSNRRFLGSTAFGLLSDDFTYEVVTQDTEQKPEADDQGGWKSLEMIPKQYHVSFGQAPIFHGCELHQDTSIEGAKFPAPSGGENAARAYRTLKLAFSKQQAVREEQRFFRFEMAEERVGHWNKAKEALSQVKLWTGLREVFAWLLYKAYSLFSDHGFSIIRPFVILVMLWLLFAQIYGAYSGLQPCWPGQHGCDCQASWLGYSLQQTLPLLSFEKLTHFKEFDAVYVGWLALHKSLSLAALFLIGLALRNLFKLK